MHTNADKSLPPTPSPQAAPGPTRPTQSGAERKKELMERMQPPKGSRPTDAAQQKGDRWVKDPVTGQDVLLKDPKFKGTSLHHTSLSLISSSMVIRDRLS